MDERIKQVMGTVFSVDPKSISDDASPGSIEQWDSLRQMNLILALEEEFDIRFSAEGMDQLISFKLIKLSIEELMQ